MNFTDQYIHVYILNIKSVQMNSNCTRYETVKSKNANC